MRFLRMPLKGMCIELRPNLCSGHVLLQFEEPIRDKRKTRIVIKEDDVHIVENGVDGDSELVLRHDCFGMDIERISVFIVSGEYISFRFNYTHIDLDALQRAGVHVEIHPLKLSFEERSHVVALQCSKCYHEVVPGCKYNRLREFPSGFVDPSEFFCHNHGDTSTAKPPSLVPGPSDMYYGLNYVVLNMAVLHSRVIKCEGHIYCKRCMWLLGICILNDAAVKLWADALRLQPVATLPRQLFQQPTLTQLVLRMLKDFWPDAQHHFCTGNNRALLVATMPNRHQHYMLLEILEFKLRILRKVETTSSVAEAKLQQFYACKLYFRVFGSCQHDPSILAAWQEQITIPKLEMSPYSFLALQRRLTSNMELVPNAWRYNTAEEKLQLSYFFYETEEQELLRQQKEQEQQQQPKGPEVKPKQQQLKEYETDTGVDASLDEEDESDDEHSDTDSETHNALHHKYAPIAAYEQQLVKRWPKQKQLKHMSNSPDGANL
ncbi:uncharacterized protein LOC108606464 isoform X2 [Drosophila busckii]|uniref:uncharacterized protein LOC108606464 isoform X2 n=1 Tax=Drosophila busckii TaxID=30019 RepID=UPI00083F1F5C|nr:uncharacterized protein LOC108606464 isoform X2 [Drosophila busckii]